MQCLPAVLFNRSSNNLLVDEQQSISILTGLADLPIEQDNFFEVLLGMVLISEVFNQGEIVFDHFFGEFGLIPNIFFCIVLLQLGLFIFIPSLQDPVNKVPH
jgi:hypothetical protein